MLHKLADESNNDEQDEEKGDDGNRHTSTTLRSRTLKATSTCDRDTTPVTKTKKRRFKEESRPDGQHSPSTATSSTLEHG